MSVTVKNGSLWKKPNYQHSWIFCTMTQQNWNQGTKMKSYINSQSSSFNVTSTSLLPGTEETRTDRCSDSEDDITISRGSQDLPSVPAVCMCMSGCVCVGVSVCACVYSQCAHSAGLRRKINHSRWLLWNLITLIICTSLPAFPLLSPGRLLLLTAQPLCSLFICISLVHTYIQVYLMIFAAIEGHKGSLG